jgi:hypothetical protein
MTTKHERSGEGIGQFLLNEIERVKNDGEYSISRSRYRRTSVGQRL